MIAGPELAYRPRVPANPRLPLALVGCGGIAQSHLQAYGNAGFHVVALCDHTLAKAEARRAEFFPDATVTNDFRELLTRDDVAVVDITTHPEGRGALIEAALRADKHVLSQKPFVLNLVEGERLVRLADECGRKLAVNQNGRWAPHFAWLRAAIGAGLIGEVSTVDFTVHWDHHWVLGTRLEEVPHLVLFDFGIHWFDIATLCFGTRKARQVFASVAHSPSQRVKPPLLAHAVVEFDGGQATFVFNGDCAFHQEDRTIVVGSRGTLRSVGPSLMEQRVTLATEQGITSPELVGCWFPDGFDGAMAELLCAIEEDREPLNSARGNLRTLALCFAAVESANGNAPVRIA